MKRQELIPIGLLLLLPFLAFGASLFHGFAPVDDWFLIVQNLSIRGPTWENLQTIFMSYDPELYIPLTLFSFQLNYLLGGLSPLSFHLTNILLHGLNAFLVFRVLQLFTNKHELSLFAGILFAVHPLNAEAVVWASGRKDLLSTFFSLLSIIFYILSVRGKPRFLVGSVVSHLVSLLSKATAIILPAVLALEAMLMERLSIKKIWKHLAPFILLSIVFIVIAFGGKGRVVSSSTMLETILMAARSSVFYVQKFILPVNLTVFYEHRGPILLDDPRFFVPLLLLIMIIVPCMIMIRRWPELAFGCGFYLITLSPTFLNFHKGSAMFFAVDRYAYLPSVGLLFLFVEGIHFLRTCTEKRSIAPLLRGAAVLIVTMLIGLSLHQTSTWSTPKKLYTHALALYPDSVVARTDLARLLRDEGDFQKAFDVLKEGLVYGDHPALHLTAGTILAASNRTPDAIVEFQKAMTMDPLNPEPHFYLGSLWEQTGNMELAKGEYEKAVAMDPSYVIARVRLAGILKSQGALMEAENHLREALKWNPNSEEARKAIREL
ncbi:MAG: tetratricopeptide repeat protein [Patescibacteria group bacterium]